MTGEELAAAVDSVLRAEGPRWGSGVHELQRLTGGASNQLWSLRTDRGSSLVLRRSTASLSGEPSMGTQARAMRAARGVGVVVPTVIAAADDHPLLGRFMLMSMVEGETIPGRIFKAPDLAEARTRFVADVGTALGRLGALEVEAIEGLHEHDALDLCREHFDSLGVPNATFEWAFRHLEQTRPQRPTRGVVHGDFRLGNFCIGPDGLRAVLDWESVHIGDPLEDLGWLCCKTWRFGRELPVGGLGDRDELLAAFSSAGGARVDADALRWWEVFASLRWGILCIEQTARHFRGPASVELAAIGRRVAEVEWDLLGSLR